MATTPNLDIEFDFDLDDPVLKGVEHTRFRHLSETEKRRVIVRVLCGLVAMEDAAAAEELAPELPARGLRRLPFLGIEIGGAEKARVLDGAAPRMQLPVLGVQRPPMTAAS